MLLKFIQQKLATIFEIMFKSPWFLSFFVFLIFFIFALQTLPNYGISWDEPTHFKRGQGYLWFLLTGDNNYNKLPKYNLYQAQNDPDYHERSIYQDDFHNAEFYRTIDGTHPPLADILSSATNMIFYQKLGLMRDIESYHLFEIFVASLGVAFVFLFVYESFGLISAIFSTILFATYPLFLGEAHFNIKDPIETSWIILTLYFLWKGVKNLSNYFLLLSAVFAGFALGTKLNVIFIPFMVLPWIVFLLTTHKKELLLFFKTKSFILVAILYPIIVFGIFYLSYPFLWDNPLENIGKVLKYYERNALDPAFANAVLPEWNFYAIRWVFSTAPPLVLFGLFLTILNFKKLLYKHHGLFLLCLLWFIIPVLRVSVPGVNIYGGVRQIMEFIPGLSILAGIGFATILITKKKLILFPAIIIITLISVYPIVKLHPNENVYFNFLTGGLQGAIEEKFPAAGNSFGNAYYQGVLWVNENVEKDSKLALLQGSAINISKNKLRSDISLANGHFSGINREGEYLMELTFNWEHRQNFYAWEYVDKFLEPVYEVKADNAVILKIWKNDLEHTKVVYRIHEKKVNNLVPIVEKNKIEISMNDIVTLSRITINYDLFSNCSGPVLSEVEISQDGETFTHEKDPLGFLQIGEIANSFKPAWDTSKSESDKNLFKTTTFYFAGKKAKKLRLLLNDQNSCLLNNPKMEIRELILNSNE